ncbi:MAG: alpha-galactosidase, partial [Opitutaceae bacterium]|nr:alpha-galactosidase [Opitutaceae bacterium]
PAPPPASPVSPALPRTQLWATEAGFHVDERGTLNPVTQQFTQVNGFTLDQQADQLARLFLLARARSIDRIYWYDLFGKNDPETFWLLDKDFNPRPAWHTLKFIAPLITDATPLGGTASTELVQQHLFRQADGGVFLAAWALRDNVPVRLHLPELSGNIRYTIHDITGRDLTAEIDLTKPVILGERAFVIRNLPRTTDSFLAREILADTLDRRNWNAPMSRWEIDAGEMIKAPCVVFNSGSAPVTVHPAIVERMPGWEIRLPDAFEVGPGETVTRYIELVSPRDGVPGVEYRLSFAVETAGPRRTAPCEVRVWLKGAFPYAYLLADTGGVPGYAVRRTIDEGRAGFGRGELSARRATVTVDGDLTEWGAGEFVTLDQGGNWKLRDVTPPLREDKYARAALRRDDRFLYAAFLVLDDDLSIPDLTSRDWRDSDNVRIFLSAEPDPARRSKNVTGRDLLLFMTPTRQGHDELPAVMAASIGGHLRQGFESQVRIASRVWHGGWLIEAAVPFSAIGITPREGLELGCNLLSDDSDHGFRKSAHMTFLKNFNYWNDPRSLGTLRLLAD